MYRLGWFFRILYIEFEIILQFNGLKKVGNKHENTHLRSAQHLNRNISYYSCVNHLNSYFKQIQQEKNQWGERISFGYLCVMLLMAFNGYFIANSHRVLLSLYVSLYRSQLTLNRHMLITVFFTLSIHMLFCLLICSKVLFQLQSNQILPEVLDLIACVPCLSRLLL